MPTRVDGAAIPVVGANGPIGATDRPNLSQPAIVIGRVGSAGAVNVVVPPAWITDNALVVIPRPEVMDFGYARYVFATVDFAADAAQTAQPLITQTMVRERQVPLLDRRVQRAIADYLDAETELIDRLVANRRQLLEAVAERPWALFVASVVAAKADRVPLRRVLVSISDGPFGSAFASADYADEGAFVVRLGNIGFAGFRHEPAAFLPLDLYRQFPGCRVHPGDLLVAGLGDENNHAGRACVAPDLGPAMVKGKCFCASVNAAVANPEYLALYLSSSLGVEEVGSTSHGSTRAMINLDIVKSMLVNLPSLQRQEEIVGAVREERKRTDRLVAAIGHQTDLLLERRQALITAAVTGQIEIPGVAA
jgi:type I restriction enzyme S subunit